ncbi:amidase [Celeribacter litoreus]|uniref:amidase n=1 Tax=Celeribacter litoreus TaxID=2876714 RepID=UPI001CCC64C6|nr:amidase [Celeribacter litoreus]MCA0042624.1 amidase [Celeribacter litoreus]
MSPEEYSALPAREIAARVNAGALCPVEVTKAALARLADIDPKLNAFVFVADDAIAQAERIAAMITEGGSAGPLAGVPVAVKDLISTKDMPTTFGSLLYRDHRPREDDISVERLRAAGAIILGKTNCSEFGYGGFGHNPLFPTTRHPLDPTLTPGGSSSGSAVAVATGICPIALGSDGGGSVRLPASFTGLVGIKASMGRVPLWPGCREPEMPGASGWESVEHIGPLARDTHDAALLLSVIAGPDPRDRHSLPKGDVDWIAATTSPAPTGLRVAYCAKWAGVPLDPEVHEVTLAAAKSLCAEISAELVECPAPDISIDVFRAVVAADSDFVGLREMIAETGVPVSRAVSELLHISPSMEQYHLSRFGRMKAVRALAELMADFDLLLTPTVACLPFPIDCDSPGVIDGIEIDDDVWTPALFPMNLSGQPAASVPAGTSASGLPIGLQIVGRHLADALVVSVAAAFGE